MNYWKNVVWNFTSSIFYVSHILRVNATWLQDVCEKRVNDQSIISSQIVCTRFNTYENWLTHLRSSPWLTKMIEWSCYIIKVRRPGHCARYLLDVLPWSANREKMCTARSDFCLIALSKDTSFIDTVQFYLIYCVFL